MCLYTNMKKTIFPVRIQKQTVKIYFFPELILINYYLILAVLRLYNGESKCINLNYLRENNHEEVKYRKSK